MNCADLDRLLEAHVGRRLTARERDGLVRHLLVCRHCRLRVQELRRFELELARRLPAFAEIAFWSVLAAEPATVAPREAGRRLLPVQLPARLPAPARRPPAPRPPRMRDPGAGTRGRRMGRVFRRTLGLAVLAALGMAALHRLLTPAGMPTPEPVDLRAPADFDRVDFVTPDSAVLRDWFRIQLGGAPPLPEPPADVALLGGRVEGFGARVRAVAVYEHRGRRFALYALPADPSSDLPRAPGIRREGWILVPVGDVPAEHRTLFTGAPVPVP